MSFLKKKKILVLSLLFFSFSFNNASAEIFKGTVDFLGTIEELADTNGRYQAQFRVRVTGTCGENSEKKTRWISFKSGYMDNPVQHNRINTEHAFDILMTSLLTGKQIEMSGAIKCNSTGTISLNLWKSRVGLWR